MNKVSANRAPPANLVPRAGMSPAITAKMVANPPAARPLDWRQRRSDNIAYALLVYTALQIFVTMTALEANGTALLPYLALVVLVAAIIPACRGFERRWNRLNEDQAADPELGGRFRRDQVRLWILAIGLPFGVTGLFMALSAILA